MGDSLALKSEERAFLVSGPLILTTAIPAGAGAVARAAMVVVSFIKNYAYALLVIINDCKNTNISLSASIDQSLRISIPNKLQG